MPCLKIPELPIPTLPDGVSLTLPVETPQFELPNLCCKIPKTDFLKDVPPIPALGIILQSGALKAMNAVLKEVRTYLHSRPLKCPIE